MDVNIAGNNDGRQPIALKNNMRASRRLGLRPATQCNEDGFLLTSAANALMSARIVESDAFTTLGAW